MVHRRRGRYSSLTRSVPLREALDDAIIALYQNGERLMPANGYPMRLFLPGYEGNMNVKYLRRIKLTAEPAQTFWEELKRIRNFFPNGKAYQFYFVQEVKSFITQPFHGLAMKEPGLYEISGVAYSGNGRIAKVMVSADGGQSWGSGGAAGTGAAESHNALPDGLALEWRSCDTTEPRMGRGGYSQPTRAEFVAQRGQLKTVPPIAAFPNQHFNAVTSLGVDAKGQVSHVYA